MMGFHVVHIGFVAWDADQQAKKLLPVLVRFFDPFHFVMPPHEYYLSEYKEFREAPLFDCSSL